MSFLGSWRVCEHVYDPDGTFVGIIRQLRELTRIADDTLRITQHNEPDEALAGHAMAAFAGEHVFDIRIEGSLRRYLGPAVIGTGRTWGEGALTGLGVWPVFQHEFRSFSVSVGVRQVTGGTFSRGDRVVARIVGAAVPETDGWPAFDGPADPAEIAQDWAGTRHQCDVAAGSVVCLEGGRPDPIEANTVLSHRSGWRVDRTAAPSPGVFVRRTEALDPGAGLWVVVQQRFVDHILSQVDVWRLRPATSGGAP